MADRTKEELQWMYEAPQKSGGSAEDILLGRVRIQDDTAKDTLKQVRLRSRGVNACGENDPKPLFR